MLHSLVDPGFRAPADAGDLAAAYGSHGLPQRRRPDEVAAAMPTILVLSCCRPPLALPRVAGQALAGIRPLARCRTRLHVYGPGQTRRCAYV